MLNVDHFGYHLTISVPCHLLEVLKLHNFLWPSKVNFHKEKVSLYPRIVSYMIQHAA